MGFSYLNGLSWEQVTREERFFCQHLFWLLKKQGPTTFLEHLNGTVGVSLPLDTAWEPAYEVCFYRDLRHLRGRTGPLFSPKRTFDLCLFSEQAILIVEAKAQQGFDGDQLTSFAADREQVSRLTGVSTYLVGLASSACPTTPGCEETFDGPLLTWRDLASLYGDDAILLRADAVYEPEQANIWGRNNLGGHVTGGELLSAFERGESCCVGRSGGLDGPLFSEDVSSGSWRTRRYETTPSDTPPNGNWFRLEDFARAVRVVEPFSVDSDPRNADWTKTTWDLPTTEAEFRAWLASSGLTVEQFKALPVYQHNKDKYEFLSRLGFRPIPDFKPGLLSDLMASRPSYKPKK